mmetsp:Transcript_9985/g.13453  ORF Transcript_9985/g.13453 Transcript_9985/m.13453 type:complete len:271 (+) Transcript_9985:60-872(+)|eukprot:CAMPEP_0201490442 /NCGR_PEP_ID=MMETSP0151_2-20130828/26556_1 /ASSEMBLY_ACC=CAM_ASM_000257 /TAXON_ID=200890 /ORGANISM="Paramoeba atlantica, Strain 621/1 / CCAP 1560/9" /LENGTH=270 /DNA_ID=CAMNT_0047876409 /DNA_START=56 /DNA_END=868 /DNA_ORIENTATION=+
MQHDPVIWEVINNGFCSFKLKMKHQNSQTFCRHPMNVTGLCSRTSCPLANSRYATVAEENGVLYLYIKTIERAHSPAKMWEKIRLHRNYAKALEQIDSNLLHWPTAMKHKCKQRLTRLTQTLIRMRRLQLKPKPKLVGIKKKDERREKSREAKALKAAQIENAIKRELLVRLKKGVYEGMYDDIMSATNEQFQEVLDQLEEEDEDAGEVEYLSEGPESDSEYAPEDLEDLSVGAVSQGGRSSSSSSSSGKRGKMEVEYEEETEPELFEEN